MISSAYEPNIQITLPNRLSTRETRAWRVVRFLILSERFAAGLRVTGAASPFWDELIPQRSETYPAVKHMAVAIPSLQENLEKVDLNDSKNEAAPLPSMSLEQCNLTYRS